MKNLTKRLFKWYEDMKKSEKFKLKTRQESIKTNRYKMRKRNKWLFNNHKF